MPPATKSTALKQFAPRVPKTARGKQTRAKILTAAREGFASDGYAGTRVTDVTERAEIALGSFYTYFHDKRDVLAALLEPVFEEFNEAVREPVADAEDPRSILRKSISAAMEIYHRNRDLMGTLMEATTVDERFAELWFEIRAQFLDPIVQNVERSQKEGLTPPLNPILSASALGGMVENVCWIWFAMGGERRDGQPMLTDVSFDEVVDVVVTLWLGAMFPGQPEPPARQKREC